MREFIMVLLCLLTNYWAQGQIIPCLPGTLSTGVLAFYSFGSGSLKDVSGNGHDLINTTTAYPTADRFNNPNCAYHFDRAHADYLQAATGSSFLDNITTSPFSISLWYQPIGSLITPPYYEILIGRDSTYVHVPDTRGDWSVGLYDCRQAVVGFDMHSTWQKFIYGCEQAWSKTSDHWHHLAFVYDGNNRLLYIDSVLSTSTNMPSGVMSANIGELLLGVSYTGDLDDVIIYNRALSKAEVISLQSSGSCCERFSLKTSEIPNKEKGAGSVAVYPNPVNREIRVSTDKQKINAVYIYNIASGQLVGTYTFNTVEASINVEQYARGMYLLKVITDNETTMHKIVKE